MDTVIQSLRSFNPRPRAGATVGLLLPIMAESVSIHAPARGRHNTGALFNNADKFQSTPPRGGD